MYNYDYITENSTSVLTNVADITLWLIISFIVAIAAGIMIYFMFLKDEKKVSNDLQKVKDFLNFKTMLIEPLLKILYIIATIFVILFSFGLITVSFTSFILLLILGPLSIRIVYELIMININIWKNTNQIKNNIESKQKTKAKKE